MTNVIGFDATPLVGDRSGVGNYTGYLLAAVMERRPEWRYLLYSNQPLQGLEPALGRAIQVDSYFGRSRWLWMQLRLPGIVARSSPDLCHFTNSMAPLRRGRPYVLSIYDASLYLYSQYHPRARILAVRLLLPIVARRAAAIITLSHSARQDLLRVLKLRPENVHVVHGAAADRFHPVTDPAVLGRVRAAYDLPEEFILYVGTVEPRKNLLRLVRALALLRRRGRPMTLVLGGPWGWAMEDFGHQVKALGLRDQVRVLGYLPIEDLPALYSLATVFAFPSLYEGFGLPPIEAMACGAPVLTSNNSSLSEICADAAYLVEPTDEEGIADGLSVLLDNPDLRHELGRRGLARAADFSWERSAEDTIAVYSSVLARTNGSRSALSPA
jgi:glycosyltransferase involved in cell wall biosynthesis